MRRKGRQSFGPSWHSVLISVLPIVPTPSGCLNAMQLTHFCLPTYSCSLRRACSAPSWMRPYDE